MSKSARGLLQTKKNLEKIRNSLKATLNPKVLHLKDFIEQATAELKAACKVSLDRSTASLNAHFAEHQDELTASKESIIKTRERIENYANQRQFISMMVNMKFSLLTLDISQSLSCLSRMRLKLAKVSARTNYIHGQLDAIRQRDNLQVDFKVRLICFFSSLILSACARINTISRTHLGCQIT